MSNTMLKIMKEHQGKIVFDENDFFGSMKRLIDAVDNHEPSEEEEYAFQYGLAIMKGSKNEIRKNTNLYKIIQAQCYKIISESESDKFVLHPDYRKLR